MKKNIVFLFIFFFSLIACEFESKSIKSNKTSEKKLPKLSIGITSTLDAFPIILANQKGWFTKYNSNVIIKTFNSFSDCDTAIIRGSVDIGFSDLIRYVIIKKKNTKVDLLSSTNLFYLLITNRKARIKNIKQLSGKIVGMSPNSYTDYLTKKINVYKTFSSSFFEVQINDLKTRLEMLINHEIDAAFLPEPQASEALAMGNKAIMDSREQNFSPGIIIFNKEKIKGNLKKQCLDGFKKAYNEACDSINKYGVHHYKDVFGSELRFDIKSIEKLSKLKYTPITYPKQQDIITAYKFYK